MSKKKVYVIVGLTCLYRFSSCTSHTHKPTVRDMLVDYQVAVLSVRKLKH